MRFPWRRFLSMTSLSLALVFVLLGCGGVKDKGINRDKDKPVPAQPR